MRWGNSSYGVRSAHAGRRQMGLPVEGVGKHTKITPMTLSFASTSARSLCRPQLYAQVSRQWTVIGRGHRTLFNLFKKQDQKKEPSRLVLSQDDLFHPFSRSPFPALRERGDAIKQLALCPVCSISHSHGHPHAGVQKVSFECPDCGWPTHCSEDHWKTDTEHARYCSRLREVNQDEHDLRSGRKMTEFELPGEHHRRCIMAWKAFYLLPAPIISITICSIQYISLQFI